MKIGPTDNLSVYQNTERGICITGVDMKTVRGCRRPGTAPWPASLAHGCSTLSPRLAAAPLWWWTF
jgi:hypothetical protein